MAAKIAIGKRLDEMINAVTGKTTAAFEPALDYCVVKIPRWPFDKFPKADRTIGTQMKATGEVMAIDRSFEGALQKAVRSLETGAKISLWEDPAWTDEQIEELIRRPNDMRLWAVMAALRRGVTPETIHVMEQNRSLVPRQADGHRRDGTGAGRSASTTRTALAREARRFFGPTRSPDFPARRRCSRYGAARRAGDAPGLQDGRHVRR